MNKDKNFTGQPIFSQVLKFVKQGTVNTIARNHQSDRYVKHFKTYHHFVSMLYVSLSGCTSLREAITGLLASSTKLLHLGLDYVPKRSTFSDANKKRKSSVFKEIYMRHYQKYSNFLSDSRINGFDFRKLFIVDSTTITLFKEILKGCGRKPKDQGKRKGGIKAHTMINAGENVPCLVRYTSAATHDRTFLNDIKLQPGSCITFDKAYNDYKQYQRFTDSNIWFITRMKENATFEEGEMYSVPLEADPCIISDQEIWLSYTENKTVKKVRVRKIVYWAKQERKHKVLTFLTNNFELDAETICLIYQRRWQIETLFKQLKQNFPLKYFLGDNQNVIEIQIWVSLIANMLLSIVQAKIKHRRWAFSNLVSLIRLHLMNYIDVYKFLEDPELAWLTIIKRKKEQYKNSLFPQLAMGA